MANKLLISFTLLIFFSKTSLSSDISSSFSFKTFGKGVSFESSVALYGDAKVAANGSLVQLTTSSTSSAGRIVYKKPIKLLQGKDRELSSFSAYFSFSMSSGNGDGLAFFIAPTGFNGTVLDNGSFGLPQSKNKVFAVEFDTFKDDKYHDMNDNHVGINVGSFASVRARNASSAGLVLNSGLKLHCWIDYESASRQLDVRLSQHGNSRPVDSIISSSIDMSKIWNAEEELFVGLSSSNRKSSQTCTLFSWSFELRHVSKWMHSEPLDPKLLAENSNPTEEVHIHRNNCILKMIASMVFATLGGALGAFVVLFLWTVFGKRRPVVPGEFADCEYNKEKVGIDKVVKDGDGKK